MRRFVRPSLRWGFILSVCLSVLLLLPHGHVFANAKGMAHLVVIPADRIENMKSCVLCMHLLGRRDAAHS